MPGDDVFNAGEELFSRLEYMHGLTPDGQIFQFAQNNALSGMR